jgi:uncharacterized protein YqgV (UPF0045/DUF77 family)
MKISIDISMYPLTKSFKKPILAFIHSLQENPGITVQRNNMSTQVFGEFDILMPLLNNKMKKAMEMDNSVVMILKVVNADLKD